MPELQTTRRPIRYAETRIRRNQFVSWVDEETGATRVAKFKKCPYYRQPRPQVSQ